MSGFGGSTGVPLKQMQDAIVQSTAWSNNWLSNTSILAYAASVANPSFTTFRTSATSTDVPIANEYYIGTVERYGQNITVKMTTMQDASKMYINNSVNGGSTWTGWKTFLDSQSTAKKVRYYTGSSIVATAYDLMLVRTTVDFSIGAGEADLSAILSSGGYTGSVAGCFAILGAVPATSVITACAYIATTKKVSMSARSTTDGTPLTASGVAVNILILVA